MIRPLAHHPHMNSGLRSLKRGKTLSLARKLNIGSFAEGGDVKHFKTGDVVHTGTMLPNYVPIGQSNITNTPTYTIDDYLKDLSASQAKLAEILPAGTATTADAINRAAGTNFTTKDLAQLGLVGTGVFVPGNTRGTVTFASTADLLNPNSPDYDPYKAAINDAMGITGTPTTTENTWGKILDAIQQGVTGIPGAAIGSLFPGLSAAASKAGTSVVDYLANKAGVDPHWLASKLGGYTTTSTPAGYTFTPTGTTTGTTTQTGTTGTGGTMGTTTGGDTLDTVDITGSKVDTTGGGGLGIVTGTGTGIDTGTTTTGDDTLDTVDITGTKTDTTKGGNTGVVTTTTPGAGNGLGTLDTVDVTGTKTDTTKGGNTGVVTTTTGTGTGTTTTGDDTLDTVDVTGTKTDTTKGGNTGVVTTTTGTGTGTTTTGDDTLDTVDITGTKTDTTKGGNTGVVTTTTGTGTGTTTTGDNTKVTDTGTKPGSTGIITTTTAGGTKDQPSDVGVPKEGAGTTTFSGIPLFKAFQSAYDPMYSASTSEKYAGTAAQNLEDYMANLNQSLRPGAITPYTFQTAPARTATPQGIASVQSAPSQGPGTTTQITQPSRMQAQGIGSFVPDQTSTPVLAPPNKGTSTPVSASVLAPPTKENIVDPMMPSGATAKPQYASNIPLIEKYALELGVAPEEIINVSDMLQQSSFVGNKGKDPALDYFLTGGGQDLLDLQAGKDVSTNPEMTSYIGQLVNRFKNEDRSKPMYRDANGQLVPIPTDVASKLSFRGYNTQNQFVGDLPGGVPLGDMGYFDPELKQTTPTIYAYNPDTQQMQRVTAGGKFVDTNNLYTGRTVAAGSYSSPTWQGGKYVAPATSDAPVPGKAHGGSIHGGLGALSGTYKAGGKLLRGPGDGMSDSIPAVIQGKKTQRAALADGEFVIPADVVSHLGNGSTDAGSRKLYAMMDKVRRARTGNPRQGKQINPDKYMPKV